MTFQRIVLLAVCLPAALFRSSPEGLGEKQEILQQVQVAVDRL
jgi:hypothetical protein